MFSKARAKVWVRPAKVWSIRKERLANRSTVQWPNGQKQEVRARDPQLHETIEEGQEVLVASHLAMYWDSGRDIELSEGKLRWKHFIWKLRE